MLHTGYPLPLVKMAAELIAECHIGSHISKKPSLLKTVEELPDKARPWQIFLGNPQSVNFSAKDEDVKACAA